MLSGCLVFRPDSLQAGLKVMLQQLREGGEDDGMHLVPRVKTDVYELAIQERHANLPVIRRVELRHGIEIMSAGAHADSDYSEVAPTGDHNGPGVLQGSCPMQQEIELLQPELCVHHS